MKEEIIKIVKQELEIYDFNDPFDYDRASLNIANKISSQLEAQVKPANGDILKTINEFFDNYFLDKDKCFYVDSLKFKNNIHFAALITRQLKIDLLSRLSV